MDWKFKENAEPQGSSNGFWYDIIHGGYIKPEEILESENQVKALYNALFIVSSFEQALEENNLLNEF